MGRWTSLESHCTLLVIPITSFTMERAADERPGCRSSPQINKKPTRVAKLQSHSPPAREAPGSTAPKCAELDMQQSPGPAIAILSALLTSRVRFWRWRALRQFITQLWEPCASHWHWAASARSWLLWDAGRGGISREVLNSLTAASCMHISNFICNDLP